LRRRPRYLESKLGEAAKKLDQSKDKYAQLTQSAAMVESGCPADCWANHFMEGFTELQAGGRLKPGAIIGDSLDHKKLT